MEHDTELQSMGAYVGLPDELRTPADRLRAFDLLSEDLTTFAEQAGASYADAQSIVAIIRQTIYLNSIASALIDFLTDCHGAISKQIAANQIFIEWYNNPKKQRQVKAAVRAAVGAAKESCDLEYLVSDAWITILKHLPNYARQSPGQEAAWIRQLSQGVGRHAREKVQTRTRAVAKALEADKGRATTAAGRSYALSYEDKVYIGEIEPEAEGE